MRLFAAVEQPPPQPQDLKLPAQRWSARCKGLNSNKTNLKRLEHAFKLKFHRSSGGATFFSCPARTDAAKMAAHLLRVCGCNDWFKGFRGTWCRCLGGSRLREVMMRMTASDADAAAADCYDDDGVD